MVKYIQIILHNSIYYFLNKKTMKINLKLIALIAAFIMSLSAYAKAPAKNTGRFTMGTEAALSFIPKYYGWDKNFVVGNVSLGYEHALTHNLTLTPRLSYGYGQIYVEEYKGATRHNAQAKIDLNYYLDAVPNLRFTNALGLGYRNVGSTLHWLRLNTKSFDWMYEFIIGYQFGNHFELTTGFGFDNGIAGKTCIDESPCMSNHAGTKDKLILGMRFLF